MMMTVLRLLSLLGLKSRWHRHFSPRPLYEVFFQGGMSVDSWTLGPKPLCHRRPTGPHPSGLLWTPAKGDSTKSNVALVLRLGFGGDEAVEPAPGLVLFAENADRPLQAANGIGVDHCRGIGRLVVGSRAAWSRTAR